LRRAAAPDCLCVRADRELFGACLGLFYLGGFHTGNGEKGFMRNFRRAAPRACFLLIAAAAALLAFDAEAKSRKSPKNPPADSAAQPAPAAPESAPPSAPTQAAPATAPAPAQEAPPASAAQPAAPAEPLTAEQKKEQELVAAFTAGLAAAAKGPSKVALLDQADIAIGADQAFISKAESLRILRALGNKPEADGLMGLIMGSKDDDSWLVVVRHVKEGYIKDDDAKNWSADELLESIKAGTEEANTDRAERGFPEIEVVGWIEKPTYDAAQHRLVWSLRSKEKGAAEGETNGVNYNTYALGRDGYFSLNLLSDSNKIESQKPIAKTLLANLQYRPGKRYQDFNAATDQVAAYGLAALVSGVAAKKLGLFALAGAFFAKFAKLILVGVAAVGAAVAKMFKRGGGGA
jgi:uncharacterized membrane-anchored protein